MKDSANKSPNKSWEKTKVQNLVRHKSGSYYARTFANNKEIWKGLPTDHFSVAKARLAEFLREHREKQVAVANHSSAIMTFAEALGIHLQNLDDDVTIKPTTRHYWKQVFTSLLKSWPGLADREMRRITKMDCNEWARRFRKVASSTRYNNTIAGLRHVFEVAIEAGIIYGNPAAKLERVPVPGARVIAPTSYGALHSPDAAKGKRRNSVGATWTFQPVKSSCVAILKREQRIGPCAECRWFPTCAPCSSGCATRGPMNRLTRRFFE
jgi:hypothetical protein